MAIFGFEWRIDPGGGWFFGRFRRLFDEALWIFSERDIEDVLPGGVNSVGLAVVNLIWSHEADTGVVMFLVVPGKEVSAKCLGIFDGAEPLGKLRLVLQGFEVAFGKWIVVRDVGSAVRFGDTEVGQHLGGGLCFHGRAAIGMQGELAGRDLMLGDGVIEQYFEQGGVFGISNIPADDPTAEDVDDNVEIEICPLGWSHQLGDVPRPDLIWAFGKQLRCASAPLRSSCRRPRPFLDKRRKAPAPGPARTDARRANCRSMPSGSFRRRRGSAGHA